MSLVQAYVGSEVLYENERDVIERWQNGDKRAFEVLVQRYQTDAYLTAVGFTGNGEDARDLSQEAFIKAFQARRRFDAARPFYPWFYRILKNHCLNFVQRVRKRTEPLHYEDNPERERFAAHTATPLEEMEKKERADLLRAAIARLSEEHREVIVLKNFRGMTYREMADLLEVPMGTIMSRLYYARKILKDTLVEWEHSGIPNSVRTLLQSGSMPGEGV